jgi:hypothetical protein
MLPETRGRPGPVAVVLNNSGVIFEKPLLAPGQNRQIAY